VLVSESGSLAQRSPHIGRSDPRRRERHRIAYLYTDVHAQRRHTFRYHAREARTGTQDVKEDDSTRNKTRRKTRRKTTYGTDTHDACVQGSDPPFSRALCATTEKVGGSARARWALLPMRTKSRRSRRVRAFLYTEAPPWDHTRAWPLRPTHTAKNRPSTLAAVAVTTGTPWWTTGVAPAGPATAVPITTCCCANSPPRSNRRLAASSSCCVR
jgi:hypothetical protein